jgi:hypothetical protein
MDWECSRHEGEKHLGSCRKLRGTDHLENPGVNGRIILLPIFRKWDGVIDWIDLPQDRHTWRALVNDTINLRVP